MEYWQHCATSFKCMYIAYPILNLYAQENAKRRNFSLSCLARIIEKLWHFIVIMMQEPWRDWGRKWDFCHKNSSFLQLSNLAFVPNGNMDIAFVFSLVDIVSFILIASKIAKFTNAIFFTLLCIHEFLLLFYSCLPPNNYVINSCFDIFRMNFVPPFRYFFVWKVVTVFFSHFFPLIGL